MRVIAGSARSVPLISAKGEETRPTTDKIKETLFNMLQGYTEGAYFLDLFAGSGQIGIEALSRGAKEAVFIERSEEALKCIKANVNKAKFSEKSGILKMDVLSGIRALEASKRYFDIVFMDPPYGKGMEKDVLAAISTSDIIDKNTLIVAESDRDADFSYTEELGYLIIKDKLYKNNRHIFLRKK